MTYRNIALMGITSRKEEHVQLVTERDVNFKNRTAGFEDYMFLYNALPEMDFQDVDPSVVFLGCRLASPLIISGMTGGYPNAEQINAVLAEACERVGVAFGLGSIRAGIENPQLRRTYSAARLAAPTIPIVANLGAAQIAEWNASGSLLDRCQTALDFTQANALAVHVNPLQELMQPEGEPHFNGVLEGIELLVNQLPVPIIVKEVGAGISGAVARRLATIGVGIIDVAGAGGTSWAGVEILRQENQDSLMPFWDVGIRTTDCLNECRGVVPTLISSGGVRSGTDAAKSIALGATLAGAARPFLQAYLDGGVAAVEQLLMNWDLDIRRWMFLTGSATLEALANSIRKSD